MWLLNVVTFNIKPFVIVSPLSSVIVFPDIVYSAFVLSPNTILASLDGAVVNWTSLTPELSTSVQLLLATPSTNTETSLAVNVAWLTSAVSVIAKLVSVPSPVW